MIRRSVANQRLWVPIALLVVSTLAAAQTNKPVSKASAQARQTVQTRQVVVEPTSFMDIAFDRLFFESKPKCAGLETFFDYVKAAAAKQLPSGGCAYYQENEGRISAARLMINSGESITSEIEVTHDEARKPTRMSGDFERDNWGVVRAAFVQRYGAPSKRAQRQMQNAFGVVIDVEDLTWEWPTTLVSATNAKSTTQGSFTVNTGNTLSDLRKSNQKSSASDIAKKL